MSDPGRVIFVDPEEIAGGKWISAAGLQQRLERAIEEAGAESISELVVVLDGISGWSDVLSLAISAARCLGVRLQIFVEPATEGGSRIEEVQQELMRSDYRTLPHGLRCIELPGKFDQSPANFHGEAGAARLVLRRSLASQQNGEAD